MRALREFQAELEKLHQQSEKTRRVEKAAAMERIRALVAEYGMLPEELAQAWSGPAEVPATAAKYRDPESGATWSGRGRAPKWMVGKDRSRYEIK